MKLLALSLSLGGGQTQQHGQTILLARRSAIRAFAAPVSWYLSGFRCRYTLRPLTGGIAVRMARSRAVLGLSIARQESERDS
jgi:hypothetical protein